MNVDIQAFFTALDQVIKKVADAEFRRLTSGMEPELWHRHVHEVLESLGSEGLQQGIPPDYKDSWVALFYLTWFQPKQIHVARSMMAFPSQGGSSTGIITHGRQGLHIVDVGCGALATLFAVAWAAADALERGEDIGSITYDYYDDAPAMIVLGLLLWDVVKSEIAIIPSLQGLFYCSEVLIKHRYVIPDLLLSHDAVWQSENRCMTAFHTVYRNNVNPIGDFLKRLAKAFDPTVGLMTCHNDQSSKSLLTQAWPFSDCEVPSNVSPFSQGLSRSLPSVTQWRRSLNEWLRNQGFNGHNFLNGEVTWEYAKASGLIYTT